MAGVERFVAARGELDLGIRPPRRLGTVEEVLRNLGVAAWIFGTVFLVFYAMTMRGMFGPGRLGLAAAAAATTCILASAVIAFSRLLGISPGAPFGYSGPARLSCFQWLQDGGSVTE